MGGEPKLDDALALFDQGRAAMARGDYALATTKLKESVARAPNAASLAAAGESLLRLSRHAEAVVHLAAAIGLGDGRASARTMLASALDEIGDRSEALRLLEDLLRDHPNDEGALSELQRIRTAEESALRRADRQRLVGELSTARGQDVLRVGRSLIQSLDPLGIDDLVEVLRTMYPDFVNGEHPERALGRALGRRYVDEVEAAVPHAELIGFLLSRMAESDHAVVRAAFDDALEEILRTATEAVRDAARRVLTGNARVALENLS